MRSPAIAPPPGQPPTTATWAHGPRTLTFVVAYVCAVGALGILGPGRWSAGDRLLGGLLVAGVAVVLALPASRSQIAVGTGWVSARRGLRPRRWVRSDDLVEVRTYAGKGRAAGSVHLRLTDRDGRRVVLVVADVAADPRVLHRVTQDLGTSVQRGLPVPHEALAALESWAALGTGGGRRRRR